MKKIYTTPQSENVTASLQAFLDTQDNNDTTSLPLGPSDEKTTPEDALSDESPIWDTEEN